MKADSGKRKEKSGNCGLRAKGKKGGAVREGRVWEGKVVGVGGKNIRVGVEGKSSRRRRKK
eukprot:5610111-Pleurochrysis_carterae.AAC.3